MGQAEDTEDYAEDYSDAEVAAIYQIRVTFALLGQQAGEDAIGRVLRWACRHWEVAP